MTTLTCHKQKTTATHDHVPLSRYSSTGPYWNSTSRMDDALSVYWLSPWLQPGLYGSM